MSIPGDAAELRAALEASIAAERAASEWPFPGPGEPRCEFRKDWNHPWASDRCALVAFHRTEHYSGPGIGIWTAPRDD